MVTKQCPNCQQYVPVACKACPCGHVFFVARRVSSKRGGHADDGEVKRRRTERTKRERPDYFNSLQIENKLKKVKIQQKSRKKADSSGGNEREEGSNSEEGSETANQAQSLNSKNKKRGRPKKNFSQEKAAEKEEEIDMFAKLPKEKEEQIGVVLSEINRKMTQQQFQID